MPERHHPQTLTRIALAVVIAQQALAVRAQSPDTVATRPDAQLPTVQVTGSALRRIDGETALPLQIFRRDDIARSGATSTVELLQALPSVQGGTREAASVGGGSYGYAGISLRNLGEPRTLVLLNGRRLAQFGGQSLTGFASAFDLNAIPLAAIDRIEVLSDGASSLYGADAIGGVVNVITRREVASGDITVGFSSPRGGAVERRISATQGWGSILEGDESVMIGLSADRRSALEARSRSFSRSGTIDLVHEGRRVQASVGSASAVPANVLDDEGNLVNPNFQSTGSCAPQHAAYTDPLSGTTACYYDYVPDVQTMPARERRSALASWSRRIDSGLTLRADALLARSVTDSNFAPGPSTLAIGAGSPWHDQVLSPAGITQDTLAYYRAGALGRRGNRDTADFRHLALGADGWWAGWDYQASLSHSRSTVSGRIRNAAGSRAFASLVDAGLLNPFVPTGQQTDAGRQALAGVRYNGDWDGGVASLDAIELRVSRDLARLPAGPVRLAAGWSHHRERYASRPSLFAQGRLSDPVAGTLADPAAGQLADVRLGDEIIVSPYEASRRSNGLYTELLLPATPDLDVTLSGRLDDYSDFGLARTAKAAFRYLATPGLLFRGSVGTGFKAPSVPQVRAPLQSYGKTTHFYSCSPALAQVALDLGAECRPQSAQYDIVAGGNAQLQAEKSRQLSVGLQLEPARAWSLGIDVWHVALRQTIGQLGDNQAFADPARFPGSFTTVVEQASGNTYLAFNSQNENLGKRYSQGVDLDATARWRSPWGPLTSQVQATYLARDRSQLEPGGAYYSSVGNNAELGAVSFRWQGRWLTTLQTGAWAHTLAVNFKSGYRDAAAFVELYNAAGQLSGEFEEIRLKVPRYHTVDWQSAWNLGKRLSLTVGVLNLFDKAPPRSLDVGGINRGPVFGYDDRYYDPRGRTLYVNLSHSY